MTSPRNGAFLGLIGAALLLVPLAGFSKPAWAEDTLEGGLSVFDLTVDAPRGPLFVFDYDEMDVTVAGTGSISATGDSDALQLEKAQSINVINNGTIQGSGGSDVYHGGNGAILETASTVQVTNTGTISGRVGDVAYWSGNGIIFESIYGNEARDSVAATAVQLTNSGTISGGAGSGDYYDDYSIETAGNGVFVVYSQGATIVNSGQISGSVGSLSWYCGNGVLVSAYGAYDLDAGRATSPSEKMSYVPSATLTNSGTITGRAGEDGEISGNGVLFDDVLVATVTNSGTISGGAGDFGYYDCGNGVDVWSGVYRSFGENQVTGFLSTSATVTNSGTISGSSTDNGYYSGCGVQVYDYATSMVTNSGSITGRAGDKSVFCGDGVLIGGNVGQATVTNSGTITGRAGDNNDWSGDGVLIVGNVDQITVTNSGTITGRAGVNTYTSGNGVVAYGYSADIVANHGTTADGSSSLFAGQITVTNSGTITGLSGDAAGECGNGVLAEYAADAVLTNSGTITGLTGSAIPHYGADASGNGIMGYALETARLTNSGAITGRSGNDGYLCGNGVLIGSFTSATVTNSGTIGGAAGTGNVVEGQSSYFANGNGVVITGFEGTMTAAVTNSGTISGSAGGGQTYSGNGVVAYVESLEEDKGAKLRTGAPRRTGDGQPAASITTTVTNSGVISGSCTGTDATCGNGVLLTDGTVNNTGTITGTNMGVVFLGSGNSTVNTSGIIRGGTGPAIQMGAGNDTVNITGGQIFGNIDGGKGTNTFNCTLDGAFTMDYNITNFQTANINVGNLVMNGEMHATSVYLQAGGILSGTGTIYGDISGPGYISPGHSVGTINVVGNVTSPGGMIIQFNDTSADLLNVTGTANLTGTAATVEPDGLVKVGGRRTVVAAGGGVSGEFGPVTPPASIFLATSFTYDPNHAYLDIDRLGFGDPRLDLNHNQRQIGNNLEASLDSPGMQTGLLLLQGYTSQTDYREALDQLSPELYDVWAKNVFAGAQLQGENLERRLFEMRYAMPGSDFAKLFEQEPDDSTALASTEAGAPAGKSPEGALSDDKRVGVWGMGGMRFGHQGTQRDRLGITQVGFDSRTESGTVGGDYRLTKNFILGLAGSLSFCDIDVRRYGSEASVQSVCVGPYMTYFYDHWYADASVAVGVHNFDMDRRIKFVGFDDMAEGDSNGLSVATNIGGGYMFQANDWVLGPTGYMRYTWLSVDGFTEKGGDWAALRILDRKVDSLRSEIGFRAGYGWKMDWGKLVPEFRARWAHEYLDGKRDIQGQFLASLAGPFTVLTAPESRNSALVGVGLTAHLRKDMAAFVNYDVDVGAKSRLNHGGNLGLRVRF